MIKKNKRNIIICMSLVVSLIVVGSILIVAMLSNRYYKVDLSEIYSVEFDGLNERGIAEIVIYEQEEEIIANELAKYAKTPDVMLSLMNIEYEITPNQNLKNGDKVSVKAKYSESFFERYKIELENVEREFVVEGLSIPQEIDVFEGLEIEFTGRSPYICCNLITGGCNEFAKEYVTFKTDEIYYARGDKVKITAAYNEEDAAVAEVKVIKNEAEYEASSNEAYLDSLENVDLTQLHNHMTAQLQIEYSSSDEYFCGIELGWTNHYTGLISEQNKGNAFFVLRDIYDYDIEKTPYNIYVVYYRDEIGVEHRSRGSESTFTTEFDILLMAENLYIDKDNVLHYDELIKVEADEVDSISDLKSVYIKEKQDDYHVVLSENFE